MFSLQIDSETDNLNRYFRVLVWEFESVAEHFEIFL